MWEGQKVIGSETYGNADHRIEYKADGSYDYYNKSGDDRVLNGNEDGSLFTATFTWKRMR